jgi:hypothetical protein
MMIIKYIVVHCVGHFNNALIIICGNDKFEKNINLNKETNPLDQFH